MHRNKADSCRARQCILSDPTAFPLPPYCSSTHGLAYEITLTKAFGNSGVSCWCDLPCTMVDFDCLLKYVSGLNWSCWRILVPLNFKSISDKQYVCHHVYPLQRPWSLVVLTSLAFNQGLGNKKWNVKMCGKTKESYFFQAKSAHPLSSLKFGFYRMRWRKKISHWKKS